MAEELCGQYFPIWLKLIRKMGTNFKQFRDSQRQSNQADSHRSLSETEQSGRQSQEPFRDRATRQRVTGVSETEQSGRQSQELTTITKQECVS